MYRNKIGFDQTNRVFVCEFMKQILLIKIFQLILYQASRTLELNRS